MSDGSKYSWEADFDFTLPAKYAAGGPGCGAESTRKGAHDMKPARGLEILGIVTVLFSSPAVATDVAPRTISTSGEADVNVVPDEVTLTLGVETSDKDLETAKSQNDARVKKIMAVAKDAGIDPHLLKTDYLSLEPRYESRNNERLFLGYWVRKSLTITLRDVSKFEDVLGRSLAAGANYVHGVDFRTTELRRHRDRARSMAIQAARQKAIALAAELGQKVGKPRSIQEGGSGWYSGYGSWWGSRWGNYASQNVVQNAGGSSSSAEGPLALGQIAVRASVSVTFELE